MSLPPGTLTNITAVQIRNATSGGPSSTVELIAGGFDPVAVSANEGDELELALSGPQGVTLVFKKVPPRRPPVVVRTNPSKGRTDVALSSRITVVFSEPIDMLSGVTGVRLETDGASVAATLEQPSASPWALEVVPAQPLRPLTTYQLVITQGVRDLGGAALEAGTTIPFTTGAQLALQGRIAFTSNRTGTSEIYLANDDGSGVTRLTSGARPRWSRDGKRIVFERGTSPSYFRTFQEGAQIHLINADGSGERWLIEGMQPDWSPDGKRIVFVDRDGISIINDDGTGLTRLIRHNYRQTVLFGFYVAAPAWSPDGTRIVFEYGDDMGAEFLHMMNADGSQPHPLTLTGATLSGGPETFRSVECKAAWSPDGSTIAFWGDGYGIATMDTERNVTSLYHRFPEVNCAMSPDWSPDGERLAFTIGKQDRIYGVWQERIHVLRRSTGQLQQLIADAPSPMNPDYSDREVAWSRR